MTFPRTRRIAPYAAFAAAAVLAAVVGDAARSRTAQPFPHNHAVHVQGKVDCLQCHAGVLDAAEDRFPTLATCLKCHKDPPGDNPGKKLLAELAEKKAKLEWISHVREPDHVFFSHERHVDVAELECTICHGPIAKAKAPLGGLEPMEMDRCMGCHGEHRDRPAAARAELDCASCHR
ncbi:MAG: hypothetical protein HYZ28_17575 [Myxococcales bacterium]|nr:hypothetical protein [Myxococcales bacterium]